MVSLVEQGATSWVVDVVTPDSQPARFAADELARYVREMSGAELAVTGSHGKGTAIDSQKQGAIVVGLRKDMPDELAGSLARPAEGFDGYSLAVVERGAGSAARIIVAGDNERGIVYGAYDLLEQLGCRWFYPALDARDPPVTPQADSVSLSVQSRSTASPFRFRSFEWGGPNDPKDAEQWAQIVDWAMKCRYNVVNWDALAETDNVGMAKRRGMILQSGGHGFGKYLKTEEYFEDHPDWFGMRNGKRVAHEFVGSQFCWSNAEAAKTLALNVERFIKQHPEIGLLSLYGLDGAPACECIKCSQGRPSDHLLAVMNRVAARLETSAPHVVVETGGGYPPMDEPPEKTQPHSRLRLIWAHWGRPHFQPYDDPDYGYNDNLTTWLRVSRGRFTAFQYYSDHFAEPWVAPPYTAAIAGDRKRLIEEGADGMANLLFPQGYWWNAGLNMHLAGRCFYDADVDPMDLVDDYAQLYFGPNAGAQMAAYYRQWAQHPMLAYHVRGGAGPADQELLRRMREQHLVPAIEQEKEPRYAYRLQKVERLHELAERLVDVHLRANDVKDVSQEGVTAAAKQQLAEAHQRLDDVETFVQSLVELNQGLVDQQLIDWFIPSMRKSLDQKAASARKSSN